MKTLYASGNCDHGISLDDAWRAFAAAFRRLPVPGQPLLDVPEGETVSAGRTYKSSLSQLTIRVEQWDPPQRYSYAVNDSNGRLISRFAVSLEAGSDGVFYQAQLTRHGWFEKNRVRGELNGRLGITGRAGTAYWGPWLRLPLIRSDLRLSE